MVAKPDSREWYSNVVQSPTAWAALFTASLLPSAPGFKTIDTKIRDFLHQFVSIPGKARAIAREIITETGKSAAQSGETNEQILLRQHHWLKQAVETLQDDRKNPGNSSRYRKFYGHYRIPCERAVNRETKYADSVKPTEQPPELITGELADRVDYRARFLSCALLQLEPSERDVHKALRGLLGLKKLPYHGFGFSRK